MNSYLIDGLWELRQGLVDDWHFIDIELAFEWLVRCPSYSWLVQTIMRGVGLSSLAETIRIPVVLVPSGICTMSVRSGSPLE